MKEVDIYDFDKTLVPFDSGSLFMGYCLLHYPWIIIFLPAMAVMAILMVLHIINFTQFKKFCFTFINLIPLDKAVKGFWDRHESQVYKWFFDRERFGIVISASPDFLLEELNRRIKFDRLICTRHNKHGVIIGENCRDEEKVKRLYGEYRAEDIKIVDVYSDSLRHDRPIFSLATNCCYHIVKGERIPFKFSETYNKD